MSIRIPQGSILPYNTDQGQEAIDADQTPNAQTNDAPPERTRKFTLAPSSSTAAIQTTFAMLFSPYGGSFYGTHINGLPDEGTSTNYTFADTSSFTGRWRNRAPYDGLAKFADGTYFKGTILNNRPFKGLAFFYTSDNGTYRRVWINGDPYGPVTLFDKNGKCLSWFNYDEVKAPAPAEDESIFSVLNLTDESLQN